MTSDDLDRIETELGIRLPKTYRKAVDPFPVPALQGNTEWMFWDDADALIELNMQLREDEKFREAWPARFYATGEDAGGCSDAIDLEDPEFGVFWFDRQHVVVDDEERSSEKLDAWIARQIEDSTHDLEAEGIDPQQSPEERSIIEAQITRKGGMAAVAIVFFVTFLVSVVIAIWKLLTAGE